MTVLNYCRVCRTAVGLVGLVAMFLARPAVAQNVGTVTGLVRDAQGLAVPGASVVIENRLSKVTQSTDTGVDGHYRLANIAFGTYVLSVALSGFTPAQLVVEVRSSVPLERDVQLMLGTVEESVTVSADALLETSAVGSHVDIGSALIDRMPSATPSKQLSAMLLSAPGFIPSQNGRVHVRGSHGQIQYVVDGVPMTDEYSEAYANPLDPRYVKSAEVMTGGIPAEYGGKLAAVVDITSKSGLDDPAKATGAASFNLGRFGAVDGNLTIGGRLTPRVGYFVTGSGNRIDRYLDPPTADNFHNSGAAQRFTGKIEFRPSDVDFVRAVVSANGSRFDVANRLAGERRNVDTEQTLGDNSQTVTWLRQLGDRMTLDTVVYRRAARAQLDASTGWPLAATQDRRIDHQGFNAALSYTPSGHRLKAGLQYDRSPLDEQFRMVGVDTDDAPEAQPFDPAFGGTAFLFSGRRVGQALGVFLQDAWTPVPDLHLTFGVRVDRYRLLVTETAVSPRFGVAYHLHDSGTVLRGSYNRIFMPPYSENLLLSSSLEARDLSPAEGLRGIDVRPERQHAFEVGVQQAVGTHLKLDVAYYRKNIRNLADVEQFLDTTVTFPVSVDRGLAQGVEARVDVPLFRDVNGYVSLSRATILLTAPLTGGLFLEDPPPAGEQFYADHDQRWQSQFGISYAHPSRRLYGALSGRYDTGIPFELPEGVDADTFEDPLALTLVDLDAGRAKPRAIVDVMVGSQLYKSGRTNIEAQVGVMNVFDTTYLLNFLSIFNGTHYGAPRQWSARLKVGF